jgi:hypothetical protein
MAKRESSARDADRRTVRNMHGALLESQLLAPGSDLKWACVAAMIEYVDAALDDLFGLEGRKWPRLPIRLPS